jgi:polyisoprenoid-binding protein YceI
MRKRFLGQPHQAIRLQKKLRRRPGSGRVTGNFYHSENPAGLSPWPVDKNAARIQTLVMRLPVLCLVVVSAMLCPPSRAQVPVFQVTPIQSSIRFNMGSSRALTGNFDKWDSTLTFASPDPTSAVLQVEIQTASVHSGNNKNDDELKSKDLLNVAQEPVISFKSNKVVQTGKTTYDLIGTFSLRGVSKPATLNLVIADQGGGSGYIQGVVRFDLKNYGMTSSRKIDERGEVDLNLKVKQVSGPELIHKRFP